MPTDDLYRIDADHTAETTFDTEEASSPESSLKKSPFLKLTFVPLVLVFVIVFVTLGVFIVASRNAEKPRLSDNPVRVITPTVTQAPQELSVSPSTFTIQGTVGCLRRKNTKGPQTLECGIALKTDNGIYYGLDQIQQYMISEKFTTGDVIQVNGALIPPLQNSPYVSKGTIYVTSVVVLGKRSPPQSEE